MNIGELRNVNGRLVCSIATRTIDLPKIGLRPVGSDNPRAPKFEVVALNVARRWVQIGAVWEAAMKRSGEVFIAGNIDRVEAIALRGRLHGQAKRVSRPFSPSTLGLLDIVTDARANADPVLAANDLPSSTNVAGNATLSLRATRSAIRPLYLDDVPLFEFVRGGTLDNATQSGSILNLGNTKDVEVYPSNLPLYLAASSGGALRALPPTAANTGGNLSLNTAAAGLTGTLAPGSGGSFITLSGLYSDLQPQLAINNSLDDIISQLRLRSI